MLRKKFISILISFFIIATTSVFSLGDDIFLIDINSGFGILHGSISEYVYSGAVKNTDNLMSRLDWDIAAVPYFEAEGNIKVIKYISINLDGKFGIPCRTGYMQDYDWLNSVSSAWLNDDPTELTNYSKHTNKLNSYVNFSISAGGTIPVKDVVFITPLVAYEYDYIKFTGSDGYAKYKSDKFVEKSYTGDVISYAQEANLFKLGINLKISPFKRFNITGDFFYSPKMTFLNALDCHLIRRTAFLDKFLNENLYQADLSITYLFTPKSKLSLKCGFEYLPLCTGEDYHKSLDSNYNLVKNEQWKKDTSLGGTSHYLWNWSLLYCFSF